MTTQCENIAQAAAPLQRAQHACPSLPVRQAGRLRRYGSTNLARMEKRTNSLKLVKLILCTM